MRVAGLAMVRHDQRPGAQRHELPGEQEGEGVGGQDHEVHGGEERREERQHARRRRLVAAVAEPVDAGRGAAEIDHARKNAASASSRKWAPIQGRPSGRTSVLRRCRRRADAPSASEQRERGRARRSRHRPGGVASRRSAIAPAPVASSRSDADQDQRERHAASGGGGQVPGAGGPCDGAPMVQWPYRGHVFSRTPRPLLWFTAPSLISSNPAASNAPISFISKSTWARTTPSLASMRWHRHARRSGQPPAGRGRATPARPELP